VYNINGGLTAFYYTNARENGCLTSLIETEDKYGLVSAIDLCKKLNVNNNNLFLLDVRADSAWKHISTDDQDNAYGHIKNSVNIPLAEIGNRIAEIPKNKEIIIIDLDGADAAKAAALLTSKGFEKVSFLIEGMDRLLNTDAKDLSCKKDWYVSPVSYNILSTKEFGTMASADKQLIFIDVRDTAVFANRHKDSFRNIGHLKNAINIPAAEINNRFAELEKYKNNKLVIYSFGGNREAYEVARKLTEKGFTNINVLANGIFDVRWTAANIKGQEYLSGFVTDVPEINR
jgi:rhodanese-related sulfurtransferase